MNLAHCMLWSYWNQRLAQLELSENTRFVEFGDPSLWNTKKNEKQLLFGQNIHQEGQNQKAWT